MSVREFLKLVLAFLAIFSIILLSPGEEDIYTKERKAMVRNQLVARDITDKRVLEAMEEVPRHLFVSLDLRHQAYDDNPLPIGEGQTISQPYIVALMTQNLHLKPGEKVWRLEPAQAIRPLFLPG